MEWIKIRSYHLIRTYTRVPQSAIALCGRSLHGETVIADVPDGKSCETCLRVWKKRET